MAEVRKVFGIQVRRYHLNICWSLVAVALAMPLGLWAQGQGRGGPRGAAGAGAPPAAGAPAPQGAPPGRGGPVAAPGGQGRGGQAGGAGGRGAASVDLTGYWVSLVTEDYIERMFPDSPRSGTNAGGRGGTGRGGAPGAAGSTAQGDPCRAYGAGGSMRMPGRLNISWADDNTLKVDMDAGTQTRLFHFGVSQAPPGDKTLQGYSIASWDPVGGTRGGGGGRAGGPGAPPAAAGPAPTRWGSLTVVTTNMKSGYLLTSRSSYTENATLTEYFNKSTDFGVDYLTVVAIITDTGGNRTVSSTFKKEPNGAKFSPTGCEIVR